MDGDARAIRYELAFLLHGTDSNLVGARSSQAELTTVGRAEALNRVVRRRSGLGAGWQDESTWGYLRQVLSQPGEARSSVLAARDLFGWSAETQANEDKLFRRATAITRMGITKLLPESVTIRPRGNPDGDYTLNRLYNAILKELEPILDAAITTERLVAWFMENPPPAEPPHSRA